MKITIDIPQTNDPSLVKKAFDRGISFVFKEKAKTGIFPKMIKGEIDKNNFIMKIYETI